MVAPAERPVAQKNSVLKNKGVAAMSDKSLVTGGKLRTKSGLTLAHLTAGLLLLACSVTLELSLISQRAAGKFPILPIAGLVFLWVLVALVFTRLARLNKWYCYLGYGVMVIGCLTMVSLPFAYDNGHVSQHQGKQAEDLDKFVRIVTTQFLDASYESFEKNTESLESSELHPALVRKLKKTGLLPQSQQEMKETAKQLREDKIKVDVSIEETRADAFYARGFLPVHVKGRVHVHYPDDNETRPFHFILFIGLEEKLDQFVPMVVDLLEVDPALEKNLQVVERHPRNPAAHAKLANHYVESGVYENAIGHYTKAIELDAKNPQLYLERAWAYERLREYDQVIADAIRSINLDSKNAEAHQIRGLGYGALGRYTEALKDLDQAISLKPRYALAYRNRALANFKLGRYEKAIDDTTAAIRIDVKERDSYLIRAFAYDKLSKREPARKDREQAQKLRS